MARNAFVNQATGEDIDDPFKDPDIIRALAGSYPDIFNRLVALNVMIPRVYTKAECADAFERMKADWEFRTAGKPQLSISEAQDLREYARSKTDLNSSTLTPDQAAYKFMYNGLTATMRETAPDLMAKIEPIEQEARAAEVLRGRLIKMQVQMPK